MFFIFYIVINVHQGMLDNLEHAFPHTLWHRRYLETPGFLAVEVIISDPALEGKKRKKKQEIQIPEDA